MILASFLLALYRHRFEILVFSAGLLHHLHLGANRGVHNLLSVYPIEAL